jgi:hypothetical protein
LFVHAGDWGGLPVVSANSATDALGGVHDMKDASRGRCCLCAG